MPIQELKIPWIKSTYLYETSSVANAAVATWPVTETRVTRDRAPNITATSHSCTSPTDPLVLEPDGYIHYNNKHILTSMNDRNVHAHARNDLNQETTDTKTRQGKDGRKINAYEGAYEGKRLRRVVRTDALSSLWH